MLGRVANRARPALKQARHLQWFLIGPAGFQAGQVYNRALTYIYGYIYGYTYILYVYGYEDIDLTRRASFAHNDIKLYITYLYKIIMTELRKVARKGTY